MDCKRVRDAVVRGEESTQLTAHLASCVRCSLDRIRQRLESDPLAGV